MGASPSQETIDKFRELVLYVARKSVADERFGLTKLNKILYACDFLAFSRFGKSITGAEYQKLPYGPAPRCVLPAIQRMEESGECVVTEDQHFGHVQKRVIARRRESLRDFSAEEIDLVNEILQQMRELNGTELSEWSHLHAGWLAAEPQETIPYETVFLGEQRPLTREETDYGLALARELGEQADSPANG